MRVILHKILTHVLIASIVLHCDIWWYIFIYLIYAWYTKVIIIVWQKAIAILYTILISVSFSYLHDVYSAQTLLMSMSNDSFVLILQTHLLPTHLIYHQNQPLPPLDEILLSLQDSHKCSNYIGMHLYMRSLCFLQGHIHVLHFCMICR